MIDLHTHILPGLDDGARDLDESLAMAEAAVADGVTAVAATPHVRGDFPTTADAMLRLVEEVRTAVQSRGLELEIVPGGELAVDALALLSEEEVRRFGLAGNRDVVLVETPYTAWSAAFVAAVRRLISWGITPVIAHPERNPDIQAAPEHLVPLVDSGALVQVTAASVDGRLGTKTRATAWRLLEKELVHLIASDAHGPDVREIGLSQAREDVGAIGAWLTQDVPAAIVARRSHLPGPEQTTQRPSRPRLRR